MGTKAYKGKLIVLEGIDGSGKSTQAKLLIQKLKSKNRKTISLEFPQYGTKSAGMVEEYLSGKYGKAREVAPKTASIFYAIDRYDLSFQVQRLLEKGYIIVSDRYVGSNVGHQGAKISSPKKRAEFFQWLYDLEYDIFGIPKPNTSLFLHVPAKIAKQLCDDTERRKKKKRDIHEKDLHHLKNAEKAYLHAAKLFPQEYSTIECVKKGEMLSPSIIHEKIWTKVQKFL